MENIILIEDEKKVQVEVIRYFLYKDIKFLVYSLSEVDETHAKIYISKVTDKIETISNEEWNLIREIITKLLKEIQSGNLTIVEDMDYEKLTNFNLVSSKPFRLTLEMTRLFAKDKKVFAIAEIKEEVKEEQINDSMIAHAEFVEKQHKASVDDFFIKETKVAVDYKKKFEELESKYKEIEIELELYKNKLYQISSIINL